MEQQGKPDNIGEWSFNYVQRSLNTMADTQVSTLSPVPALKGLTLQIPYNGHSTWHCKGEIAASEEGQRGYCD